VDYNLFDAEPPLREALEREGGSWAHDMVRELGRVAGTAEAIAWGFQANSNPPQLRTHDRFAFCASRLAGDWGHSLRTLPQGLQLGSIVQRHRPSS
jgi:putative acyl-CoA dehydrogenase